MLLESELKQFSQINLGKFVYQPEPHINAADLHFGKWVNFHFEKTWNDLIVEGQIRTGVPSNQFISKHLPDTVFEHGSDLQGGSKELGREGYEIKSLKKS